MTMMGREGEIVPFEGGGESWSANAARDFVTFRITFAECAIHATIMRTRKFQLRDYADAMKRDLINRISLWRDGEIL